MKLTAIILTFNEQVHISRCIESVKAVGADVLVIDSQSSDDTVPIARSRGAAVLQHEWINYAEQFNWALGQLDAATDWVLRIDADEYLTPPLTEQIQKTLPALAPEVDGVYVRRRMTFQGKLIKHGGVFPVHVLRLFRYGRGRCEDRWMDEHVKVSGPTVLLQRGELIDDNRKSLTWWIEKHNQYASREAIDLLNLRHHFLPVDSVAKLRDARQAELKRWIKERLYARLPPGVRAACYFLYRYVVRLGFLDGQIGTAFHILQGFWYRYIVDQKVMEVERYVSEHGVDVPEAIRRVLRITVKASGSLPIEHHK